MNQARSALDSDWREAICDACAVGHAENLSIFAEERHDVVVEMDSVSCSASATTTRTAGLNVSRLTEGGSERYLAGGRPEHLQPCLDYLDRDLLSPPPNSAADSAAMREFDCEIPVQSVERAMKRLQSRLPGSAARIRWVGFRQQMWANRGEMAVGERRRADRLRIDVETPAGALLTGELALRSGREAWDPLLDSMIAALEERVAAVDDAGTGRSGDHEVVLAPGVGGILAHELIGHALEADTVLDGRSWLAQFEETRLPGSLTVLDDPRRGRAPWQLDDEGQPATPTALLREGKVGEWLHDLRSARRCRRSSNGHGRRGSFRDPVRPRMGCTFIANGRLEPQEILSGVADGIYVRRMEAASTDSSSGRASFRVSDADRIANGKIVHALPAHLLIVDGPQTLAMLDQTGNDLAFDSSIGGCVRDGQPLAVSVGAPTICIGLVKVVF